jgi:hypothetical protein
VQILSLDRDGELESLCETMVDDAPLLTEYNSCFDTPSKGEMNLIEISSDFNVRGSFSSTKLTFPPDLTSAESESNRGAYFP